MQSFQTHPLSFLPTFSVMLHELLEQTKIQYRNLLEAKTKPHVLDDRIIERLTKVYREQQEQEGFWVHQLDAWQKQTLTENQHKKIHDLMEPARHIKIINQQMLDLIEELAPHTLTKLLQKDPFDYGLELLSRPECDVETIEKDIQETAERMKLMRDEYVKIRALLGRYIPRLLPQLPRGAFEASAQKLKLYENGKVLAQTTQEVFVQLDYCLFHSIKNGKNLVEQHIETHITTLSDEEKAVYGLLKHAFFAVLRIDSVLVEGGIAVFDLIREEYYILFDQSFARTAQPGMLLVCHLVKQSDFVLTTGASIPLSQRRETREKVLNNLKTFFILHPTKDQRTITKLATEIFKLCIWDDAVLATEPYMT